MKIDRFVKVMLVVIALLLAINCAKDLNPPWNSGGNLSVSSNGGFNLPPVESVVEAAAGKRIEYKVVKLPHFDLGDSEAILSEAILNQHGSEGWEIAYGYGRDIILKREK